ncbi:MAG: TRIC cation channel family protein [Eubacteriales bacterium]|nr:TRIC cation channel family protein [Eubacteriales bacterium]
MDYQGLLVFVMEMVGTVAFAASGAMVGAGRGMDVFGICVLGVVTAVGGGVIRDLILGVVPPGVFQNPVYALVAVVTSCAVFGVLYRKKRVPDGGGKGLYDRIMLVMDSVGLGIFTVVGVNTGIRQGYLDNTFLLIFVGTVTGVGGGILRDMMAGVPPYIFVRHVYACASIAGAVVCVYASRILGGSAAMLISCGVVLLIRYLAAHYRWNLPRLR